MSQTSPSEIQYLFKGMHFYVSRDYMHLGAISLSPLLSHPVWGIVLYFISHHLWCVFLLYFVVPVYGVYIWCRSGMFLQWTSSTLGLLPCNSYLRVLALLANFLVKGSSKGDYHLRAPYRDAPFLVIVVPLLGPLQWGTSPFQEDVTQATTLGLLLCKSYLRVLALLANFLVKGSSKGDYHLRAPYWDAPFLVVVVPLLGPLQWGTYPFIGGCYLGRQFYTSVFGTLCQGAPTMGDISFLRRMLPWSLWPPLMQKLPTGAGAAGELPCEGIQSGRNATNLLGPLLGSLSWQQFKWYPFWGP